MITTPEEHARRALLRCHRLAQKGLAETAFLDRTHATVRHYETIVRITQPATVASASLVERLSILDHIAGISN